MSTGLGACCSIVLVITLLLFTLAKVNDYYSQVYNMVNVSEYIDRGFYDSSTGSDRVKFAFGLQYKEEYQAEMVNLKEEDLKKVVNMKMTMMEKVAGVITPTRIRLNVCSTTEISDFYSPSKSS